MDLRLITEGGTELYVPVTDPDAPFPPSDAPVFYNPEMVMNRDASLLLLSVIRPESYLDTMGATGIRGIRAAKECNIPHVTVNDHNPVAVDLIGKNAGHAGVDIEVIHSDVNALMSRRRFDAVDLDPFGTPAPFVDAAAKSAKRFLMVSATDTAPLCGAHLKAGIRRYNARPMNTEYHGEVALRILAGFVARSFIRYDRGVEPIFCYTRSHYVRACFRLSYGTRSAERALSGIGYIMQCRKCFYREEVRSFFPPEGKCPCCGAGLMPVGQLWLGPVNEMEILSEMKEKLSDSISGTGRAVSRLLDLLEDELDTSSHYDYHKIAQRVGGSPGRIENLILNLRDMGYRASRVHYSGTGIKTDAPVDLLCEAVRLG